MIGMKPNELKEKLSKTARTLGFDDIRFVKNPLMDDKPTAAFLIKRYVPADGSAADGEIALSEYYPCSQFGHETAQEFVQILKNALGIDAEMNNMINYKKQVLKTGGTIGVNTLYYHPEFGSYISMRCVLIGAEVAPDVQEPTENLCASCNKCTVACPTKAIDQTGWTREKCLRNMISEGFPENARKEVYQLLGCERCQLCCPMNPEKQKAPHVFDLLAVLQGKETKHLKAIAGKNMATRTRLLTQTMAYAAAKGFRAALPEIEKLTCDALDRVKNMAIWAKAEIEREAGE